MQEGDREIPGYGVEKAMESAVVLKWGNGRKIGNVKIVYYA